MFKYNKNTYICNINTENQFLYIILGEYKTRKNIVSDIITANPNEVIPKMNKLLAEYEAVPVKNMETLSKFHAEYERIHPFQDGNGRTGRLLLFKECLRNKIIPFVILDQSKEIYYEALNAAQNLRRYESLIKVFEQEQKYFYSVIQDFLYVYK